MQSGKTEQEFFWEGAFGNEYAKRNRGDHIVASNTALFATILSRTRKIGSLIEFGANIGLNLWALATLLPDSELAAVEINASAVAELQSWGGGQRLSMLPSSSSNLNVLGTWR